MKFPLPLFFRPQRQAAVPDIYRSAPLSARTRTKTVQLAALALAVVSSVNAYAQRPDELDTLTQQWLDLEKQADRLDAEWVQQKPVLQQRLTLLDAEKEQLSALLETSSDRQTAVESRRAELLAQQAEQETRHTVFAEQLAVLQQSVDGVIPLLPPPLHRQWEKERNRESDASQTNLDTSKALTLALAQLTQLAEFDRRITVLEDSIPTENGDNILVKQLYLGAGIAWFVSPDQQTAGWGQPNDNGWQWHFDTSMPANAIAEAIAMHEKRQTADMIRLPIKLQPSPALMANPETLRSSTSNGTVRAGADNE